mgnify:CR=1 FL=1
MCGDGFATLIYGDVSERPKVPASKAGVARATEGSNPSVTASWVPGICISGTSLCSAARRPQGAPRSSWFQRFSPGVSRVLSGFTVDLAGRHCGRIGAVYPRGRCFPALGCWQGLSLHWLIRWSIKSPRKSLSFLCSGGFTSLSCSRSVTLLAPALW